LLRLTKPFACSVNFTLRSNYKVPQMR
jgi:hypothetical protein